MKSLKNYELELQIAQCGGGGGDNCQASDEIARVLLDKTSMGHKTWSIIICLSPSTMTQTWAT